MSDVSDAAAAQEGPLRWPRLRRALRRLGWGVLALYFLVGGLFLVVRHVLWPNLDYWRPTIERIAGERLGVPVRLEGLSGYFFGLNPGVSVEAVLIGGDDGTLIEGRRVDALIGWRSLVWGTPSFERLDAKALRVMVERLDARRVRVGGYEFAWPAAALRDPLSTGTGRLPLPRWLLSQQGVDLRDLRVDYVDRTDGARAAAVGVQVLTIEDSGERSVLIDVPRFEGVAGALRVEARLRRSAAAEAFDVHDWDGEAKVHVAGLDTGLLADLLHTEVPVDRGIVDAELALTVRDGRPISGEANLRGEALRLRANASQAEFRSASARLGLRWSSNADLVVDVLDASAVDAAGNEVAVGEEGQGFTLDGAGRPVSANFTLQAFDALRFMEFARALPFPPDMKSHFARLQVQGRVDRLQMSFDARSQPTRYAIDAGFQGLGVSYALPERAQPPNGRWAPATPSGQNLTGSVSVTERGGSLRLDSQQAVLEFPGAFAEPRMVFDALTVEVDWSLMPMLTAGSPTERRQVTMPPAAGSMRRGAALDVQVHRIAFANGDAAGHLQGRWRSAPRGAGVVDLTGRFERAQVAKTHRYLPLSIPPKTREWVQKAVQAGSATDFHWRLRGDLVDFPFRDPQSGEFLIHVGFEDGRLVYARDWPRIDSLAGVFQIERGGMSLAARAGRILTVDMAGSRGVIRDLRRAVLDLDLRGRGAVQQMLRYVDATPLGPRLDGFVGQIRAEGEGTLRTDLSLPFDDLDAFELRGSVQTEDLRLVLADYLPPLDGVRGEVGFDRRGLSCQGVRARALGGAVRIDCQAPDSGRQRFDVAGRATAEGLRRQLDTPLTRSLDGAADYTLVTEFDQGALSVAIDSPLAGMASDLPAPVGKQAATERALRVRFVSRASGGSPPRSDEMRVWLGDTLNAVFERRRDRDGQMRVRRGAIGVGAGPRLPESGLRIAVATDRLIAQPWAEWLLGLAQAGTEAQDSGSVPTGGYFRGFDLIPSEVSVTARELDWGGRVFAEVNARATRAARLWLVDLASREVAGSVEWQLDPALVLQAAKAGFLKARFERLEIPALPPNASAPETRDSLSMLPAMDVEAAQLVVSGRELGRLELRASVLDDGIGWRLDRISLEHPAARLAGSGAWQPQRAGRSPSMQLDFDLDLRDSGALLAVFGQPGTLEGGAGKLSGQIGWRGSPLALDLPSANGRLALALGRGQFLKTEPGLAKLVGVLSLQAIPRRMQLDFTDVFAKGFAFDAMVGEATIQNGLARSENLLMHGVQAEVLIGGEVDLVEETQALEVRVLPNVNAGLASIAYAALANPAIGLGSLVAQMVLQRQLREIFAYEFTVNGPWGDPRVERVESPAPERENPVYGPG